MPLCINQINSSFAPVENNLSPNIRNLQHHFDLFDPMNETEMNIQKKGFVNTHLYLNTQTLTKHTECGSSYTIIFIPPHEKEATSHGKFNKGEFGFNLTEECSLVLPLEVGTILVYSAYLLNYRQQVKKINHEIKPFKV